MTQPAWVRSGAETEDENAHQVVVRSEAAEQIGQDQVLSYRHSPVDMVNYGFYQARIRLKGRHLI